jgi:dipeptidyl aminopeptidase/acylaminoacyl peptidase
MLSGMNERAYAVEWFAGLPYREELARKLSPLTYVRNGLPPVMSIQGDADPIVPYSNSTRLRDALISAGVPNELVTIPGGGHISQ